MWKLVQLGISEWEFGTYPILLYLTCVCLSVCVRVCIYTHTHTLYRNTRIYKLNYWYQIFSYGHWWMWPSLAIIWRCWLTGRMSCSLNFCWYSFSSVNVLSLQHGCLRLIVCSCLNHCSFRPGLFKTGFGDCFLGKRGPVEAQLRHQCNGNMIGRCLSWSC